jgi:hypothetical protein
VTIDALDMAPSQLQREVLRLSRSVQKPIALLWVLLVVLRMSGYSLSQTRLPDGGHKRSLLHTVKPSRAYLSLRSVLRVVRLSPSRYHAWNGEEQCALDDKSSCPRSSRQQLTPTKSA